MDAIRLLLAGLLSFVALLAAAGFAFKVVPKGTSPALIGLTLGAVLIVVAAAAWFFLNLGRRKTPPGPTLNELQSQGMVVSENYQAKRAFEIEEFEDEGRHYFIELADGSVLYLNGQYLYDYGDEQDGSVQPSSQSFPNTDFTLLRHRTDNYVLDIVRRGAFLPPETVGPSFQLDHYDSPNAPEDGDVIRDRSYDTLKAQYAEKRKR